MELKTFIGETAQEALGKVKQEFGDEALIVTTKEIKRKTLTSKGLYEVVVAIPKDKVNEVKKTVKSTIPSKNQSTEDVFFKLSEAAKEIDKEVSKNLKLDKNINNSSDNYKSVEKVDSTILKKMEKELSQVKDTLKLVQNSIWDVSEKGRDVTIPPEFSEIYLIAKKSGMEKSHLDNIMKLTLSHMPPKMRHSSITVKRYFNTLLKKMIPIRKERIAINGNKKIMMLVGPTGVGKTTTIAKLAARFAYKMEKKYKVGIITLDTYRIGAVEQLMTYAKMMKLSIETVIDPNDFISALNNLRDNDYILIDTVGSSQNDRDKIEKIYSFLNSIDSYPQIDVSLVLSATTKYEDLKDIYKNFSLLPIDTFVFTKLDETSSYGNLFSLVYDESKPISYFSMGQEVPDDLKIATSEILIDSLLNVRENR